MTMKALEELNDKNIQEPTSIIFLCDVHPLRELLTELDEKLYCTTFNQVQVDLGKPLLKHEPSQIRSQG